MSMSLVSLPAVDYPLTPNHLPMPPIAYAAIALSLFALGLMVLWFFRNTAQKVSGPVDHHGEDLPGTHADIGYDTHTMRQVKR